MDAQSVLGDPGIKLNAEFTIVIPTASSVSHLDNVLSSIRTLGGQLPEVMVVQNGIAIDPQANRETLRRFDEINLQILHDEIPGQLAGRHRGFHESDAEILIFIDDDVVLSKTWLDSIREAFTDLSVMLVGGPSIPDFESTPPDWLNSLWQAAPGGGRMLTALSLLELDTRQPVRIEPTLIWGLNFAIRRSALQACGGFHPDCVPAELQHFQGDGETGLCLAIAAAGGKAVYHPGALVHHQIGNERMTARYFEQRYFYQGVCDSYTQLRSKAPLAIRSEQQSLFPKVRSVAARLKRAFVGARPRDPFGERFAAAYQRGFEFHQHCVSKSPLLRNWVNREDYFDYQYPCLEADFVPPRRHVHQS